MRKILASAAVLAGCAAPVATAVVATAAPAAVQVAAAGQVHHPDTHVYG